MTSTNHFRHRRHGHGALAPVSPRRHKFAGALAPVVPDVCQITWNCNFLGTGGLYIITDRTDYFPTLVDGFNTQYITTNGTSDLYLTLLVNPGSLQLAPFLQMIMGGSSTDSCYTNYIPWDSSHPFDGGPDNWVLNVGTSVSGTNQIHMPIFP